MMNVNECRIKELEQEIKALQDEVKSLKQNSVPREEIEKTIRELKNSLSIMVGLARLKFGNLDPEVYQQIQIAEQLLQPKGESDE